MRPAVFLDRDGVLNEDRWPTVLRLRDLVMLPGAPEAVAALTRAGWPVFIVTNKTAMGWGLLSEREHRAIMERVLDPIARAGGKVQAWYYCPHNPLRGCECRKPKPGMLLRAAREHGLDLHASWMVGDTWRDVRAGRAAGARTILVGGSAAALREKQDHSVADLPAAVRVIGDAPR
ncbi:MAG: HAD family hydrolase [Halobacteriales archaeon]|nr:HAD family hydrolase [Halobacteriales archaeon]